MNYWRYMSIIYLILFLIIKNMNTNKVNPQTKKMIAISISILLNKYQYENF